ncbi:MAG: hypothetical protein GC201_08885 [Alphaproteobacteria bacterium]|nr:hypothetical protein [Alphaproteobacteria bacterium]
MGPKKTVAVALFESPEMLYGSETGAALSQMLVEALMKDPRFVVLERVGLADVQVEQQLNQQAAAASNPNEGAKSALGASVIIRGTVTKFEPQAGGASISVGGLGFLGGSQGAGMSDQVAKVEIALRLVDAATGQILATGKAEGSASSKGFNANLYSRNGMQIGTTAFQQTPLGNAAEHAIDKAVEQIDSGMEKVPWSALVIDNSDGLIYLNAGANQRLQVGSTLYVYHKVKDLVDPATGLLIDTIVNKVGRIEIQTIRDKTAIAVFKDGEQPIRGDILKFE